MHARIGAMTQVEALSTGLSPGVPVSEPDRAPLAVIRGLFSVGVVVLTSHFDADVSAEISHIGGPAVYEYCSCWPSIISKFTSTELDTRLHSHQVSRALSTEAGYSTSTLVVMSTAVVFGANG